MNNPILFSDIEVLNYMKENGIINLDDVQNKMNKQQKQLMLEQHPYSIWQGKNGRWYTYLSDDTKNEGRKRIVKTDKANLEKEILKYYEEQSEANILSKMTLKTLYPKWLAFKELHTTAETYISRIESDWKKFYLNTEIINQPIKALTKLDLDNWVHQLIKNYQLTKNAYYNMAVIMRQSLDYAIDLGIIEINPLSLVKIDGKRLFRKVKKKPNETQVFSQSELEQIVPMAWKDFHTRIKVYELAPLAFLFQFQTGLRLGEVCAVRYEDIETSDYIHVQRMLRRATNQIVNHTKSECGDRQVLLTSMAKKLIKCAKKRQKELGVDTNGYIFSINGLPLTERSIADLYRKYCRKLEIVPKSSHNSRKTYISSLIDQQVNINTVREMVGHTDERTTLNNYCFDRSTSTEKRNKIETALNYG